MKIGNSKKLIYGLVLSSALLVSCSTQVERQEITKNLSPQELMNYNKAKLKEAQASQANVLAAKDYRKATSYYRDASEEFKDDDQDVAEIKEDVEYSVTYLDRAIAKSEDLEPRYRAVLDARRSSINYGALSSKGLRSELRDIDDDFISLVDENKVEPDEEEFVSLQKDYFKLRDNALIHRELGQVQDMYEKAIDNGARFRAPNQQDKAWKAIELAKTTIKSSPTEKEGYEMDVRSATKETIILNDLIAIMESEDSKVSESVAMKLYEQQNKIADLDGRVDSLREQVGFQVGQMMRMDDALIRKDMQLGAAERKAIVEEKFERVKKIFSPKEATVVREGDSIVIKMKSVNFPVGQTKVPEASKQTLAKVTKAVASTQSTNVTVVGHTDTTGSKSINEKLSKKRAENVAKVLKNEGLNARIDVQAGSFEDPVAANNSKTGRQQNRRVDIVLKSLI